MHVCLCIATVCELWILVYSLACEVNDTGYNTVDGIFGKTVNNSIIISMEDRR